MVDLVSQTSHINVVAVHHANVNLGCSSLEGFLQENGPISWQYGTYKPVYNPWNWATLTNIVWVEQPVGTGFTQGTPTANNTEEAAQQFLGFFKNFIDTFSMQGYTVYITGQ